MCWNKIKKRGPTMMKKMLSLLLAGAVLSTVLVGCSSSNGSDQPAASNAPEQNVEATTPAASGSELKFTTGNSQGTYYAFGSVLAGQVTSSTDTNVVAVEGKGSQENI